MAQMLTPSLEISYKTPSADFPSQMEIGVRSLSHADEELDISPTIIQKVIAEFMGTFILLFIGCGSGFIDQRHNITIVGIAFAWSLTLMAMIYTLGHISGAHFNPAVTAAFTVTQEFPWKQSVFYVVAQLAGAILGSLSVRWLFHGDRPHVMLTLPATGTDDLTAVAWEIMASFVLMWVICGAATDPRAIKEFSGAAVGAAIFLDVLITGKITGASMNPARSIGPAISAKNFRKIWIYIVSPIIGTIAAASLYNLLRSPNEFRKNTVKKVTGKIKSSLNPAYYAGKEMELP